MSLTSYRAAPPRVTDVGLSGAARELFWPDRVRDPVGGQLVPRAIMHRLRIVANGKGPLRALFRAAVALDDVNGFLPCIAPASMPGDDLLFQRLSVSTIGAVWFHGRVRDGIGWVTDAMATKQWSRRDARLGFNRCVLVSGRMIVRSMQRAFGQDCH